MTKTSEAQLAVDLEDDFLVVLATDTVRYCPAAAVNASEAQFPVALAGLQVSAQISSALTLQRLLYADAQSELMSAVLDFGLLKVLVVSRAYLADEDGVSEALSKCAIPVQCTKPNEILMLLECLSLRQMYIVAMYLVH